MISRLMAINHPSPPFGTAATACRRPARAVLAGRTSGFVHTHRTAKQKCPARGHSCLAEGVGFEPTRDSRLCRFSRPVHSTTLPPFHYTVTLAAIAGEPSLDEAARRPRPVHWPRLSYRPVEAQQARYRGPAVDHSATHPEPVICCPLFRCDLSPGSGMGNTHGKFMVLLGIDDPIFQQERNSTRTMPAKPARNLKLWGSLVSLSC